MYTFTQPIPIVIKLADSLGFELRRTAAEYLKSNITKGAERGNKEEQGFGALAEIVVRNAVGFPLIKSNDHPLGYDILLPSGIKVDIKCRGGKRPFQEVYISGDRIPREAKHNFFARQLYDKNLDADIFLMTHLERPEPPTLPGTTRQKKWILYVCGWVTKERVENEGVYIPRGSLTEQGNTWFTYRGQEIEFYNRNLNGLQNIQDLLKIDKEDIKEDRKRKGDLNLTSVDAIRIVHDLIGRGVLHPKHLEFVKEKLNITKIVSTILHPNQYYHLMQWLIENKQVTPKENEALKKAMKEVKFEGI